MGFGQSLPKADIPIERFYQYPLINGRSPSNPKMSPDGSKIVFGWNETGARKLDLWSLQYPSGKKQRIVDASKITDLPRQDDTRTDQEKSEAILYDGGITGADWSPDGDELMFSYKGRVWLTQPDGSELHPIVDGQSGIASPQFTPDGKYISYVSGQNLFRLDRHSGAVKQLTFISKPNTKIESATWSQDGKTIAVTWSDSSKEGKHVMMDFSKDRATVVNIQREWNGDLNVDNQIGLIPADGGIIRFVSGLPRYLWLKDVEWSPDGSKLAIAWIKDDFKEFTISVVDPAKAEKADVYNEKAPMNYITDWRPLVWTKDGESILFGTDIVDGRFGYRSVMKMDADGKNLSKFYSEGHDVAALGRPKESDRIFLVTLGESPLKSEITVVEPDGKRTHHKVMPNGMSTPKEFDAAGLPLYSDDGGRVATLASDRTVNPELYSVEPTIKRLTKSQLPEFEKVKWADFKEVTFKAPDGRMLHGLLIARPGLDLSQKHPAFISNVYANSGKAAWSGFLENYAAMNLDMVVLALDFRASWGYGGEFNSGYYRQMGLIDVDEAVAAKEYLASLPYVRGDRVGIWGWSYGGYLTCMSLLTKPGVFHTGVAVASVTDWKSYNEWYTRRRLGLVKDDPKIFEKTSPITYAGGLQDNLLLVHGIMDDNVLFQDTARLIQRLIDNGKYFDEMTYPRDDHSIGKDTSRPHVFATILRYLYGHLSQP
ncbi:dipeptidyl-peptidase [Fimbriimonas ginsengisoli Gsoil 348]|uniref:Dipeptidyl-peptidase n=1 Tax=Fimbriimonas ginsengisoli Gsoil 348 TaxID=661478 RepID=A0A068NUM6_FIMGI|nr:dipeptidyl-peptidase [Fimbriimonas ginsengisoli Gsoil 348]